MTPVSRQSIQLTPIIQTAVARLQIVKVLIRENVCVLQIKLELNYIRYGLKKTVSKHFFTKRNLLNDRRKKGVKLNSFN